MTLPTQVNIVIAEITPQLDPESDLETRLRDAMQRVQGHWMATDEDHQFRGAVGAVMLSYGERAPEFHRVLHEMRMLQQVHLMMQAAQIGMPVGGLSVDEDAPEPIGLLRIWNDVKEG